MNRYRVRVLITWFHNQNSKYLKLSFLSKMKKKTQYLNCKVKPSKQDLATYLMEASSLWSKRISQYVTCLETLSPTTANLAASSPVSPVSIKIIRATHQQLFHWTSSHSWNSIPQPSSPIPIKPSSGHSPTHRPIKFPTTTQVIPITT